MIHVHTRLIIILKSCPLLS